MIATIGYIIYSLIASALLMLWYQLALRDHKSFNFNRLYILSSLAFLVILPFSPGIFSQASPSLLPRNLNPAILLESIEVKAFDSGSNASYISILAIIYSIVCLFFFVRLIARLVSLFNLIKTGERIYANGSSIILHNQKISPFSFFSLIVISKDLYDSEASPAILMHERAHAQQWHSLDVLIFEFVAIFIWFNPSIWWMKKSMVENHEYLADHFVLKSRLIENYKYQQLIVYQSINMNFNTITNNFHQSLIKNRISKMTTFKTNRHHVLRALMCLPVFYFTMIAYGSNNSPVNHQASFTNYPVHTESLQLREDTISGKEAKVYDVVETMPIYGNGGEKGLMEFLAKTLVYPEKAREDGATGKVFVQFVVNEKGLVENAKVIKSSASFYNKEQMKTNSYDTKEFEKESLRVINALSVFTPGMQRGVPVKVEMVLPISFKLD